MRDKPYKVFVSHSIAELEIAETVCNCLNNAFGLDKVNFTYSSKGLYGGMNWRQKIHEQLNDCEAGLFLFTPQYIESPWSIAEYAVFWIQDKNRYLFTLGNADYKKIFGIVDENIQIEDITNREKTRNFFDAINSIVNPDDDDTPAPYNHLDSFIKKCTEAYEKCEQKRTGRDTARYSYLKDHTSIEYSINEDKKNLKATIVKTLGLRCLSENLPYINVFKDTLPTLCSQCIKDGDCEITARVADTTEETSLRVSKPHKCQFRVNFNPVLRKEQEIEIEVKVVIPAYRVATFEECLNNMKSSRVTLAEQSNIYTISEQTNNFLYEIIFPINYSIQDKPPIAKSRKETNAPFKEDEAETKLLQQESGWERKNSQWQIKFERNNPQIGMSYYFSWVPPNESDI